MAAKSKAKPVIVTVEDPIPVGVKAKSGVTKKANFRGYLRTVGIDIGTSSSCYAFAYVSSQDKIDLSSFLPGEDYHASFKAPTSILTEPGPDGACVAFGYEAERKYRDMISEGESTEYNLYTDFKMVLYREQNLHKEKTMVTSLTGTERPLMDMYVMTLQSLQTHMMKAIETSGASTIDKREVRWVMCVPATWTDKAKDFLRHAAYKADLIEEKYSDQLLIILEATAAALYCQLPESRFSASHLERKQVPVGTRYLVIDAGAGTVDYTAQEVLENERVKEIAFANGGDWGARHVDKDFLDLLKGILDGKKKGLTEEFIKQNPEEWYDIQLSFEQAKALAKPEAATIGFKLPQPLFEFMAQRKLSLQDIINGQSGDGVRVKKGKLIIDIDTMRSLFDPTIQQIADKTTQMLDNDLKNVDFNEIFLVGGFASSPLLQSHMKSRIRPKRLSVPKDAQAAVVKGAVIYGCNPSKVTRIAKKTYGVKTFSNFDEGKHLERKKIRLAGVTLCQDLFLPIVQKREVLDPGTHGYVVVNPVVPHAKFVDVDFYVMDREKTTEEVLYVDSEEVKRLKTIRVHMPNTEDGIDREVLLNFSFEDEIRVIAVDKSSDSEEYVKISFDYDVR